MIRKCIITFFCICVIATFDALSQPGFQKHLPRTYLSDVKQTTDSGFVVTGWNMPASGGMGMSLTRFDKNGDTIWSKAFFDQDELIAFSMDITSDSGYIISGQSMGVNSDVYILRTDANGNILWVKKYGGAGVDLSRCIHKVNDGGYIISGHTNSFGVGGFDIFIIKTDLNGNIEWSKAFGDTADDYSFSICPTVDSGFVALGILKMWSFSSDLALIKINSLGDTLWTKTYGLDVEHGYDIIETHNHGFAITGFTTSFSSGIEDAFYY